MDSVLHRDVDRADMLAALEGVLTLKVDNHFVLPIANPFLLCPDV